MNRERVLKLVMVLVGLLFVAAVYPMIGGVLHAAQLDTGDRMMITSWPSPLASAAHAATASCGLCCTDSGPAGGDVSR